MEESRLTRAMILAAGFGTRLRPLTDHKPKPLVEIDGKPMIEYVIRKLVEEGITDITVNTHYLSAQLEQYFNRNDFGVKINLSHEDTILGTGGGIKHAKRYLEDADDFLVYNTDVDSDIDLNELYKFHVSNSAFVTLAVKHKDSSRALLTDESNNLVGKITDKKPKLITKSAGNLKNVTFCGIHVLSSKIFKHFPEENNFDIISVYMNLVKDGKKLLCFDIGETKWRDLGTFSK